MRTVLITGTNRGLGLEFVRQYSAAGWRVIACCRDPGSAHELKRIRQDFSDSVDIFPLDVSDLDAIGALSLQLKGMPVDVLINNAGAYGSPRHDFNNIDYLDWQQTFLINTLAPMKIAEVFVDNVTDSRLRKMIFLTSKMGSLADNTSGGSYIYRSSKSALNAVTKSLSIDLMPRGISVLTLHPGWVKTDMGGPHALITTRESVESIRSLIEDLSLDTTGRFLDYQGNIIPW